MKTKYVAIAILVAASAIWFGRVAWRAHYDLVTLHVRNAPLAEVVRAIERQTRERFGVDEKLDARITLEVKNAPLVKVLDQISTQAGARWSKLHAVYREGQALRKLESVFRGQGKLADVGWTNLAPHFNGGRLDHPAGSLTKGGAQFSAEPGAPIIASREFQSRAEMDEYFKQKERQGFTVARNEDDSAVMTRGGPSAGTSSGPGHGQIMQLFPPEGTNRTGAVVSRSVRNVVRKGPGGSTTTTMMEGDGKTTITRTSSDGKVVDEWSSERLVLEERLFPILAGVIPANASIESALQTAKKVEGHCVTYYRLEKSPFPMMSFEAPLPGGPFGAGGTNHPLVGDIQSRIQADQQRSKMEKLKGLPEERVQRARQSQTPSK